MQIQRVHQALDAISDSFNAGQHEHSLEHARRLKHSMQAEPPPDPLLYGWARYYELKSLYSLQRFREAFELLESNEPFAYAISEKNLAHAFSIGSELAMHLGRRDDVITYGRRCLELRRSQRDWESAAQCAATVCALLARLDADEHNGEFALELATLAERTGQPERLVTAARRLLDNIARTGDRALCATLAELVPRLRALGADKLVAQIERSSAAHR